MTRTCGGEEYFMPTLDRVLGLVFIHVHIVQYCSTLLLGWHWYCYWCYTSPRGGTVKPDHSGGCTFTVPVHEVVLLYRIIVVFVLVLYQSKRWYWYRIIVVDVLVLHQSKRWYWYRIVVVDVLVLYQSKRS